MYVRDPAIGTYYLSYPRIGVIICGTRHLKVIKENVFNIIDSKLSRYTKTHGIIGPDITIIEGGAYGADLLGYEYATARNYKHKRFDADWLRYGDIAGYIRNQEMLMYLDSEAFDIKILISIGPLSTNKFSGTNHIVALAEERKTVQLEILYSEPDNSGCFKPLYVYNIYDESGTEKHYWLCLEERSNDNYTYSYRGIDIKNSIINKIPMIISEEDVSNFRDILVNDEESFKRITAGYEELKFLSCEEMDIIRVAAMNKCKV